MRALWGLITKSIRTTSSAGRSHATGMATAAAVAAAVTTDSLASTSKQLRLLADMLESKGPSSAADVATSLQQLSQQLLQLHSSQWCAPAAVEAATSTAEQAATAAEKAKGAAPGATAGAANTSALERCYAAPAAAGAAAAEGPVVRRLSKRERKGQQRTFDITRFEQRRVVLQLMYVGWSYQGFARQQDSDNTIEGVLFPALRRTKLIPEDADINDLNYSRCGRTDKGVSALGQVLCLRLRSAAAAGEPLPDPQQELDYPMLLNRVLPDTIRVLGWCDAPGPDFSARFSCASREYKYFIVQDGSLDVAAMQEAAQHLLGEHDFRHFCKADVVQVQNFMRHVLSVSVEPVDTTCGGMSVLALHIKGTAFLWHQVRCIAAVLLMVGKGLEQPEVVQQLLDMNKVPCKPQYNMAAEDPLLLYRCLFNDLQQWHCSTYALSRNLAVVSEQLQQHLTAAALTGAVFEELQQQWQRRLQDGGSNLQLAGTQQPHQPPPEQQEQQHMQGPGSQNSGSSSRWLPGLPLHMPMLKRACEPSMEERFSKAGISLEVLNQKGGARMLQAQDV